MTKRYGLKDRSKQALDELCSEYVRKRAILAVGGCERCGTKKYDIPKEDGSFFPAWKQLQWAHILIGRANHHIRWDEDAALGLCPGCHFYIDSHPLEKVEFAKQVLGDKYDLLIARSNQKETVDVNGIGLYLKQKLKELEAQIENNCD